MADVMSYTGTKLVSRLRRNYTVVSGERDNHLPEQGKRLVACQIPKGVHDSSEGEAAVSGG